MNELLAVIKARRIPLARNLLRAIGGGLFGAGLVASPDALLGPMYVEIAGVVLYLTVDAVYLYVAERGGQT